MLKKRHRWIRSLTAGLAFAALAVPAAQAGVAVESGIGVSSDAAAGYDGYGYQHGTGVPVELQGIVRPDDRDVRFTPGAADVMVGVRPDDRGVRFSPAAGDVPVAAAPSDGFGWRDAGIGAGVALGLALLGLGAAAATRRTGRKALAGA